MDVARRQRRLVSAAIVASAATAAIVVAAGERDRVAAEREAEAARVAAELRSRLDVGLDSLRATRGLFEASRHVTRAEFKAFAADALRPPTVSESRFVVRVQERDRRSFERRTGFRVRRPGGARAPALREHFPILYVAGLRAGRRLPGLDVATVPARRAALARARDLATTQATRPIRLLLPGRPWGFLVYEPVYRNGAPAGTVGERRRALVGLVEGVFQARGLSAALEAAASPHSGLDLLLEGNRLYHAPGGRGRPLAEHVRAAGRSWQLRVRPAASASLALPAVILLSGLVLAALVAMVQSRLAEREQAERALREAEARFHRAFDEAGVGMALVGMPGPADGVVHEANDALCTITGRSRGELLATRYLDLIHPGDRPEAEDGIRRLLEGQVDAQRSEERWLRPDGREVWVLSSSSLVEATGVAYLTVQVQDITERKLFEGRLQHLADHDPLTGLLNRRRFEQELEHELALAARYGGGGAVLAIDLDNFKYTNDTLGHSAGDDLIKRVGALLSERLRESDVLARIGGDEFAVILPRAGEEEASRVAQDLVDTVRAGARVARFGRSHRATASVGSALYGEERKSPEELLIEADIAMYSAKDAGRDRIAVSQASERRGPRLESVG